jgi:hypothetical protein
MSKKLIYFVAISAGLLFSGCTSTPKVKTKWVQKRSYSYQNSNNPIKFRYKPVIGTKQEDAKVMIDMGEWAKIWVKNYKNKNETFVATHTIVTKVRDPNFIAGEQIPRSRRDTTYNSYGARSFTFKSQDLIYDNSSHGSKNVSDEQVKEYINSYEYSKKTEKLEPQRREKLNKYNSAIKDYLKNSR